MSVEGKVIIFSRKLSKSRHEMEDEVLLSLRDSKNLDFIICDIGYHSTQLKKCKEFSIELLTEKEYRKLFEPVKRED